MQRTPTARAQRRNRAGGACWASRQRAMHDHVPMIIVSGPTSAMRKTYRPRPLQDELGLKRTCFGVSSRLVLFSLIIVVSTSSRAAAPASAPPALAPFASSSSSHPSPGDPRFGRQRPRPTRREATGIHIDGMGSATSSKGKAPAADAAAEASYVDNNFKTV